MKKIFLTLIFSQTFSFASVLDSIPKSNPIVYLDVQLGIGRADKIALSGSYSINFQSGKNLYTARILNMARVDDWFFIFPITGTSTTEIGLLYGRRYIENGESLSFSAGLSQVTTSQNFVNEPRVISSHFGVPFEFNYMFFNAKKARYHILYGLIPIGKPTALGRSIGFKLFGNISKNSFFGFGVSTSIGWHKKY